MKITSKKFVTAKSEPCNSEIDPYEEYEVFAIFDHEKFTSGTGVVIINEQGQFGVYDSSFFE